MAFHASSFIFDGVPCEEHNLMLYSFGEHSQQDTQFITREVFEDRLPRSYQPLYYGSSLNRPLEFDLVFGLDPCIIDKRVPMDRWDMEAIALWLTGPDGYRDLIIVQDDLGNVRYKSMISELRPISVGNETWAFSCKVRCDSPYGYLSEQLFTYQVNLGLEDELYSRSTHPGYYHPIIVISGIAQGLNGRSISIVNQSDDNREMLLKDIPEAVNEITIDTQRGIILNNAALNLYNHFNFNFFRLLRGKNLIKFCGRFTASFICNFPVNVGG
jgi:phage-related protein